MAKVEANVTLYSGVDFAATYNDSRPAPPARIIDILCQQARQMRPKVVVDLGSGTGLSTRIWYEHADLVYGVEPSDDMRKEAEEYSQKLGLDTSKIKFLKGDSGNVSLEDGSVDIITCSQSLHWMEPTATFKEVQRLLRPGGVFAAIDCDWPPVINSEAENMYTQFLENVRTLGSTGNAYEGVKKWEKDFHLQRIIESGIFSQSGEVFVNSIDKGNAQRLIGLAMSMGHVGTALRKGVTMDQISFDKFKGDVEKSMGQNSCNWYLGYRVRIGIK
jgi:ubiquinone/menaquinone biosynthesis C-methylase UbiE